MNNCSCQKIKLKVRDEESTVLKLIDTDTYTFSQDTYFKDRILIDGNYEKLENKPSINDVILVGNKTSDDLGIISKAELSNILAAMEIYTPKIYVDTMENWNSDPTIRTEEKTIYVYTDYQITTDGKYVAGIKIGDGDAYLIDMPFIDTIPMAHISNTAIHVSEEDRAFWNNKVRCYLSLENEGNLVFTTQ